MNFIVRDTLINPPTSIYCFRDLTFWLHWDYRDKIDNILIEGEKENWDKTWAYLKFFKAHDFIYDFIRPSDRERGIRLDDEFRFSPTVQAPYVNERNVYQILRAVSYNF